jgi:SAM-dependent methyltransferase
MDAAVSDLFGFHALQVGLPELMGLRANRMPYRWLACPTPLDDMQRMAHLGLMAQEAQPLPGSPFTAQVLCEMDALPFEDQSLDLVVLPHTLEWATDPHLALREVERVLVPEGRVLVTGFNPSGPWAWRQKSGRWVRHALPSMQAPLFLPEKGEFLGMGRLKDWMALLGFEVESVRFGCFMLPVQNANWLRHLHGMEQMGQRWWPLLGAVYGLMAVKRVRGMRLVGLVRHNARIRSRRVHARAAHLHQHQE